MDIIKLDFNEMVTLQSNQVMTTSLKVAEYSLKRKLVDVGYMVKLNPLNLLDGIPRRVYFDRPKKVDINVSMVIGRYKSFNDINTEQIKSNLKNLDFDIGENVYSSRIISSINLVDGFYIKELTVNGSNIANIDHREYAQINNVEVLIE